MITDDDIVAHAELNGQSLEDARLDLMVAEFGGEPSDYVVSGSEEQPEWAVAANDDDAFGFSCPSCGSNESCTESPVCSYCGERLARDRI